MVRRLRRPRRAGGYEYRSMGCEEETHVQTSQLVLNSATKEMSAAYVIELKR